MNRSRLYSAVLIVCCITTGSVSLAAELSFHSGDLPYMPFSLERGEAVPTQLLGRLAAKAELNRSIAKKFACMEEVYREGKLAKSFDYLLGETPQRDIEALRFKGRRRASFSDSFPPAFAWSLLFSGANQAFFTYRYLGESLDGYDLTHRITFRGTLSFQQGRDIREWEGSVIIDRTTLEIIRVEAVPRIYAQVLEFKRAQYRRSFTIGFFGIPIRFRRAPRVQVLEIEFNDIPVENDLSEALDPKAIIVRFPSTLVWLDYKVNFEDELVHKKTEERRYLEYRFFDVGTRTLEYGASVGE